MKGTLVVGAALGLAWLVLFRGPLFQGEVCAFRDAGNFYYPLFSWQCSEWSAGRIPLWNPLDGLGVPVVDDGTSSLFYPGKWVFLLPVSFDLRFNLYLAGHVLFAAWSLFFVARRWGSSAYAAGIGGLSYACGGFVLFQYCNVVFAVSAAWLPLAVWYAERSLCQYSWSAAIRFGLVLAMMILGGDPQTAYHAVLAAGLYAFFLWRSPATVTGSPLADLNRQSSRFGVLVRLARTRPVFLAAAVIVAAGVAAIQILPTWDRARSSDRVTSQTSFAARFAEPQSDTHAARTYEYSLAPWRMIETIWPNFGGRAAPIHQRWMALLPNEGKYWTPSLYIGLIPWLAAVRGWSRSRNDVRVRWLAWLTAFACVASWGGYGMGWVVEQVRLASGDSEHSAPWLGQPVGGLYWLLNQLLPAYAQFRYPAKWFVVAAVAGSLLAARGVDWFELDPAGMCRVARVLCLTALATGLVLILARPGLLRIWHGSTSSQLYGPLQAADAWRDMFAGAVQVAILSAVLWRWVGRVSQWWKWSPAALLLWLTVIDLTIANHWLVLSVPSSQLAVIPTAATALRSDHRTPAGAPPLRILHLAAPAPPESWRTNSDRRRLESILTWELQGFLRRHHLRSGIAVMDAPATLDAVEWNSLLRAARRRITHRAPGVPDAASDWLGIDRWGEKASDGMPVQWTENPWSWPRAWLENDPSGGRPSDRSHEQIASPRPLSLLPADQGTCRIIDYQAQRVELEVRLSCPARLVLCDAFDEGWVASYQREESSDPQPLTIHRAYHHVRSVDLPAGRLRVVFRYTWRRIAWGGSISLVAILIAGVADWRLRNWELRNWGLRRRQSE